LMENFLNFWNFSIYRNIYTKNTLEDPKHLLAKCNNFLKII